MILLRSILALVVLLNGRVLATETQDDAKTVWDGVYTETQASRGKSQFEMSCSSCHRNGPYQGDGFMRAWSGSDVEGLFRQIRATMPTSAPASLNDRAYFDIVAYLLQTNSFPAGASELSADLIRGIRIEGKNGPEPVPNYALVRAVGCLDQDTDETWILARGDEPVRTKDPAASKDSELKESEAARPGAQTFRLLNVYPSPDRYKGYKVEVKGFLIRDSGGDRINVTSLQTLALRCN